LLASGELPNLARLRQQGGYAAVGTTYPALTPAAWSTFATGLNPGGHGIFEFVGRDPRTYFPILAMNRYEQRNAFLPPKAVNSRRGTPIWEVLTRAGLPSTVVRCPCTYPADKLHGRLLAGVGVPDLRGSLGTSTFYSAADDVQPGEGENVVQVRSEGANPITTYLIGPRNPKTRTDLQFPLTLHLDRAARTVAIETDGQPRLLTLREGEWSDWLKVKFRTGPLQSVRGTVRFFLVRLEPVFELYASPVNFDPEAPLFPISYPQQYAAELSAKLGTFYTTGMVEDHGGLNNDRLDEAAYLDQCESVLRERRAMMLYELERLEEGFFFCLFDTPDRVAHMFWRYRARPESANGAGDLSRVVEEHYRACDRLVGEALSYVDQQTLAIVLSDHGMSSFERGLHLNTWLHEQGFLALKADVVPGGRAGDLLRGVDWERTKAYALGLGGIYLNLKGREQQGLVEPDDAEQVKADLIRGLTGLPDPERGRVAIRSVMRREQIYRGAYVEQAPDLLLNFAAGYRVSWGTPMGGVPAGLFEDNPKKWSGDHVVDPALVPGVLFMNQPFRGQDANLVDLAPTILAHLGVEKDPAMEGESLLE
jgi:predicted AlkP superfamily phosphohydrolase/phosphomutase